MAHRGRGDLPNGRSRLRVGPCSGHERSSGDAARLDRENLDRFLLQRIVQQRPALVHDGYETSTLAAVFLAGIPATTALGGTSRVTTAPAPTSEPAPTRTPPRMI